MIFLVFRELLILLVFKPWSMRTGLAPVALTDQDGPKLRKAKVAINERRYLDCICYFCWIYFYFNNNVKLLQGKDGLCIFLSLNLALSIWFIPSLITFNFIILFQKSTEGQILWNRLEVDLLFDCSFRNYFIQEK